MFARTPTQSACAEEKKKEILRGLRRVDDNSYIDTLSAVTEVKPLRYDVGAYVRLISQSLTQRRVFVSRRRPKRRAPPCVAPKRARRENSVTMAFCKPIRACTLYDEYLPAIQEYERGNPTSKIRSLHSSRTVGSQSTDIYRRVYRCSARAHAYHCCTFRSTLPMRPA